MQENYVLSFRKLRFFSDLSDDTFHAMFANGKIAKYERGTFIIHRSDENIPVLFVLKGLLEILRTAENGREQVIGLGRAGDGINLIPALLEENGNRATIRAVTSSELLNIQPAVFNNLLSKYPDFSKSVVLFLAQRLAQMTDLAESLALTPVRARLARFLIQQADNSTTTSWTQEDIARQIGSVRDVVGRTLRTFELNGLITFHRNRISLLDKAGLIEETRVQ